jgi:hypothetical protein
VAVTEEWRIKHAAFDLFMYAYECLTTAATAYDGKRYEGLIEGVTMFLKKLGIPEWVIEEIKNDARITLRWHLTKEIPAIKKKKDDSYWWSDTAI